jgi:hypothetical protein
MTAPRIRGGALLLALLAAAVALIGVELGKGAARSVAPAIADPCRARSPFTGEGVDAVIQRIVLDGLDGAACRLRTTREELVLSLGPDSGIRIDHVDRRMVEAAIRAGLLRAVDEAERRGDLPAFLASVARRVVESAPVESLIRGGITLGQLFR